MIDVQVLKGSEVRSRGGSRGFIDSVTPARVRVRWEDADFSRYESCLRSDTRLRQMDILTLTGGWVPLNDLLGLNVENTVDISKLTTELKDMLESGESLAEKSKHWPFKNKDTLGTTGTKKFGPPPKGTRSVSQTDDWICKKKGKYMQICKSGDKKKLIRIKKGYKKKYNKAYRKWLAKQG